MEHAVLLVAKVCLIIRYIKYKLQLKKKGKGKEKEKERIANQQYVVMLSFIQKFHINRPQHEQVSP